MGLSDLTILLYTMDTQIKPYLICKFKKALLIFQEGFLVHDILNTLLAFRNTNFTLSRGK